MEGTGAPPKGPFDEFSWQYLRGLRHSRRAPHPHGLLLGHHGHGIGSARRRTAAAATSSPDAGAPPGAEILGRPGVGEPFKLTIGYTDTPKLDEFEVTVDEVRCGEPLDPKVLAHAADSVTVPSPTPTPEDGKQFCVVTMEVLNTGKGEADWSADGASTLNVDDTAYSPTQSDNDLAKAYEEYRSDQGEADPSSGINPGSKGPEHGIFQIPAGDRPTTLWVASAHLLETINGVEPGYLVQLTPTD